jgi:hypothetical protein
MDLLLGQINNEFLIASSLISKGNVGIATLMEK